jgi:hypothetical protein
MISMTLGKIGFLYLNKGFRNWKKGAADIIQQMFLKAKIMNIYLDRRVLYIAGMCIHQPLKNVEAIGNNQSKCRGDVNGPHTPNLRRPMRIGLELGGAVRIYVCHECKYRVCRTNKAHETTRNIFNIIKSNLFVVVAVVVAV